tara:strand:+ start:1538 stop:3106 length:1569 start_codon:yes stop_codon:yes gene_type:complete
MKKRRTRGLFYVPLRYVFMFIAFSCIAIQAVPAGKQAVQHIGEWALSAPVPEDMETARVDFVADDFGVETADLPKVGRGPITPPVSRKITAMLASLPPAAGKPIVVSGVSMPEPRPEIFKKIAQPPSLVSKRIAYIEREGIKPVDFEIESGDTLADAFVSSLDVSYDDVQRFLGSLTGKQDPKALRPGQKIKAYTVNYGGENMLLAAEIQQDVLNSVSAFRISEDRFAVTETTKPIKKSVRAAKGSIENSLYMAASNESVPDRLIIELIHALSWSVDFQRDIRTNDEFEILFEEYRTEDGDLVPGKGEILYAALKIGDKPYSMYQHIGDEGQKGFYEADGQSIRKALMTTPVNGARISSNFGKRKHPVLGYTKMHKGTDFAAPSGTPIYASGDGVIEYIGRRGSFGNYIKIRHRGDLHSAYAHMKGFKKGLANGHRVKQGDVIGYVGTTGRSTGPHLHYEVHVNNKAVDPKSIKLPTGTRLAGAELKDFKAQVKKLEAMMKKHGLGKMVVAALDTKSAQNVQ